MIYETYSHRKKQAEAINTKSDYIFNEMPQELRHQIIYIWMNVFGDTGHNLWEQENIRKTYEEIVKILREEIGVFILPPSKKHHYITFQEELQEFFLHETNNDKVLDVIQLCFQYINTMARDFHFRCQQEYNEIADTAIADLNTRFKQHNIGYRFEANRIIRIDSEFMHAEMTAPVLKLLTAAEYSGAQEEFLTAHKHHKAGDKKDVLTNCLKAFESIMKSICTKRGWAFKPTDTASPLIQVCLDNQLIPSFLQNKMTSLKTYLRAEFLV